MGRPAAALENVPEETEKPSQRFDASLYPLEEPQALQTSVSKLWLRAISLPQKI